MSQVLLEIASQAGVSISLPSGIESERVTVDNEQADTRAVLNELVGRMELVPRYSGGILTFAKQDVDTNDFIVVRSGYIPPDKMRELMKSQLGEKASVDLIDDRVVITAPAPILERAAEIAEQASTGADAWLLDIKVVTLTETLQRELGLDWTVGGTAVFTASNLRSVMDTDLFVQVIAQATQAESGATLLDTANLHVVEGTTSTLNRGQRIPVPKFTTTNEGATNLTGFEYINTGFILEATATRVPGGVRLTLSPTISSVTGFVREAPITQESAMTADVIIQDGEWVILTGLQTFRDSSGRTTLPGLDMPVFTNNTDDRAAESIQILIRANRVYSSSQSR